jgi:hypothetical protein
MTFFELRFNATIRGGQGKQEMTILAFYHGLRNGRFRNNLLNGVAR